jgi:hypothetical protein
MLKLSRTTGLLYNYLPYIWVVVVGELYNWIVVQVKILVVSAICRKTKLS